MKRLLSILLLALPLFTYAANEDKEKNNNNESLTSAVATLQGTIGDVSNYQPLDGVKLTLTAANSDFKKTVETDQKGRFLIENLPEGVYKVKFEKPGYEPGGYPNLVVNAGSSNNFGFLLFED